MSTTTMRNSAFAAGFVLAIGVLGAGCLAPEPPGGEGAGNVGESHASIDVAYRVIQQEISTPTSWQAFWWLLNAATGEVIASGLGLAPPNIVALVSGGATAAASTA